MLPSLPIEYLQLLRPTTIFVQHLAELRELFLLLRLPEVKCPEFILAE
jgi:hypothetical protein